MKQENERMDGLLKLIMADQQGQGAAAAAAAAAAAHQEAELVQHRDFLPLWLDPSEFNEEFDNALRPPPGLMRGRLPVGRGTARLCPGGRSAEEPPLLIF